MKSSSKSIAKRIQKHTMKKTEQTKKKTKMFHERKYKKRIAKSDCVSVEDDSCSYVFIKLKQKACK